MRREAKQLTLYAVGDYNRRRMQEWQVEMIDNRYDAVRQDIDRLGCRGDCFKCPAPTHATADKQLAACIQSLCALNRLEPEKFE